MNSFRNKILISILAMASETLAQVHENTVEGPNGGSITISSSIPSDVHPVNKFEIIGKNSAPEPIYGCSDEKPDEPVANRKDKAACELAKGFFDYEKDKKTARKSLPLGKCLVKTSKGKDITNAKICMAARRDPAREKEFNDAKTPITAWEWNDRIYDQHKDNIFVSDIKYNMNFTIA